MCLEVTYTEPRRRLVGELDSKAFGGDALGELASNVESPEARENLIDSFDGIERFGCADPTRWNEVYVVGEKVEARDRDGISRNGLEC